MSEYDCVLVNMTVCIGEYEYVLANITVYW